MGISIIRELRVAIVLFKTNVMNTAQVHSEYLDALKIVRHILSDVVSPDRISLIAHKCYVPIVLDGNCRQTICRLYITPNLYLGMISARKVETKIRISNTADIGRFADEMFEVVKKYNGNR